MQSVFDDLIILKYKTIQPPSLLMKTENAILTLHRFHGRLKSQMPREWYKRNLQTPDNVLHNELIFGREFQKFVQLKKCLFKGKKHFEAL